MRVLWLSTITCSLAPSPPQLVSRVLEAEQPDLAVLGGDMVSGFACTITAAQVGRAGHGWAGRGWVGWGEQRVQANSRSRPPLFRALALRCLCGQHNGHRLVGPTASPTASPTPPLRMMQASESTQPASCRRQCARCVLTLAPFLPCRPRWWRTCR